MPKLSDIDLNKAVGLALGFQPGFTWEILNADETASMIGFEREAAAIKWWDEHPSVHETHHMGTWGHWPNFSESIEAAMQVVERLRDLHWSIELSISSGATFWDVILRGGECVVDEDGDTLPLAICNATLAAIGSKPESE